MYLKLANPDQNELSTLQFPNSKTGCCGSAKDECKYTASTAFAQNVKGVNIDGTAYTFTTAASDEATLKAGLQEALKAAGYKDYYKVGLKLSTTGGTTTVIIITDGVVNSLINANDTTIAPTVACTKVYLCEMQLTVVGTVGDIGYNGSTDTPANNPYNYTVGNPGANTTAASTLETDLDASLTAVSAPYTSVAVTVNDTAQAFSVVISGVPAGTKIFAGTKEFEQCNCVQDYSA